VVEKVREAVDESFASGYGECLAFDRQSYLHSLSLTRQLLPPGPLSRTQGDRRRILGIKTILIADGFAHLVAEAPVAVVPVEIHSRLGRVQVVISSLAAEGLEVELMMLLLFGP
jgi:hypothetical protein